MEHDSSINELIIDCGTEIDLGKLGHSEWKLSNVYRKPVQSADCRKYHAKRVK